MSLKNHNQITQALTIGELSEHHGQELIPASEMLDILVTTIGLSNTVKLASIEKSHSLGKYILVLIHCGTCLIPQSYDFKSVRAKGPYN